MANKDALRELQTRLASRLQAAKTQPRARGWLAVECAGVGLLLPLAQAGEIFPLRALLKLPHAKPWMTGVAQLRGDLYTVIDMAAFLGLRAPKANDPAALDGQPAARARLRLGGLQAARQPGLQFAQSIFVGHGLLIGSSER